MSTGFMQNFSLLSQILGPKEAVQNLVSQSVELAPPPLQVSTDPIQQICNQSENDCIPQEPENLRFAPVIII